MWTAQRLLPDGRSLKSDAKSLLLCHSWPGNLPELWSLMTAVEANNRGKTRVTADALAAEMQAPPPRRSLNDARLRLVVVAFFGGNELNVTRVGKLTGMARATVNEAVNQLVEIKALMPTSLEAARTLRLNPNKETRQFVDTLFDGNEFFAVEGSRPSRVCETSSLDAVEPLWVAGMMPLGQTA